MTPRRGPLLMGIVNVTPDSFSDGGRFLEPSAAVAHGLRLLDDGADVLDVGGESTRPGADPVASAEEIRRVVPVVAGLLRSRPDAVVSVDTSKAAVARAAVEVGARMVNDVSALGDPEMAPLCAASGVDVVLMHRRGTPRTMQDQTRYGDVVAEVAAWLAERTERAVEAGIARERLILDPGIGFAKGLADNLRLLAGVPVLARTGQRVLIGASRKRFLGELLGVAEPADRVFGSVGAALAAASRGAALLRVHDVAATRQALTVYEAVEEGPR